MILLTTRIAEYDPQRLGLAGRVVTVVAPGYPVPAGVAASSCLPLEELLRDPTVLDGGVTMLVVGLARLLTPANRVRLGRVLLRPRPGLRRIVLDEVLFVVDPWRAWWPFYAVGQERWGFTDSFQAETRWRFAQAHQTPDPFDAPTLRAMAGVVVGDAPFRFPPLSIERVPVSAAVHAAYAREKAAAFEHEKTVPAILRRLAAVAQAADPQRTVPTPARLFRRGAPVPAIRCTDLPIDRFLVDQLLHRVALTNAIADACAPVPPPAPA